MRGVLTLVLAALAGACGGLSHEVQGLVLRVDRAAGSVTVSHDPVPGVMDAMVMPFTVARADALAGVRPGDRIKFRLRIDGERSVIERLDILSPVSSDAPAIAVAAQPATVAIGDPVTDFTLTNQHDARLSLVSLRGKVVVVSFIYTRCPLPDYCPRVMTNLAALRDRFRDRLDRDLALLTVTFDPRHDTPGKLKAYADRYTANVAGWHLVTGSLEEIGRVCAMFGVEFWPDEGMIAHSLQTVIIDRHGRLAAIAEGKAFSTRQLGDLVTATMESP